MNLGDLRHGGGTAGPDRPDRLIGDDRVWTAGRVGNGAGQLGGDHRQGGASVTLAEAFADADDGGESRPDSGGGLGGNGCTGFRMVLAALGMADDHVPRPQISPHFGADIACEGAGRLVVAVLTAQGDGRSFQSPAHQRGERGGRADGEVHPDLTGPGDHPLHLGQGSPQAVHLPVAGHQLPAFRHRPHPKTTRTGKAPGPAPGAPLALPRCRIFLWRTGFPFAAKCSSKPSSSGQPREVAAKFSGSRAA